MIKTSDEGMSLIKNFEGLRLTAYQDIAGVWTIGYGHTGSAAKPDTQITQEEAENLLALDLLRFEQGVFSLVHVPITQSMADALVSLSYNIGLAALARSTAIKRLAKGNYAGAAAAMMWWNRATIDGKKTIVPGLVRRRAEEASLFLRDLKMLSQERDYCVVATQFSSS